MVTGLDALVADVCPYMLAEWINRINYAGVFSGDYIRKLEDSCETWSCRECWEKFLKEEVPIDGAL